ncbi:MAG: SufD family Fe-S cluster assembly protein, partial [Candidatus Poseidoniaceae archaeon]|nr:SufD family Fe-S cluster assembly protein [Candidatus Poseidoniaceae archaeon]
MESCHLHFNVQTSGNVCLRLSGNSKWFGLSITAVLQKNVAFSFAIVNNLNENCTLLRCEDWEISRDSSLEYGELSTGADRIKSDIRTYLKGTNSTLTQNIAVNCDSGRVDDHHIEIHHLSPHSNSSLCVNSACANKGHAIGTGLLIIEENCDGSDAGQVFKNLLLSEDAKAEAIPELEVLSDDVSAAHGAASSSVDPE